MTKFDIPILTPSMAVFLQTNVTNDFNVVIGDAEYLEVEANSYSNPIKIFRNFSPSTVTFSDDDEALLFKLRFFNEVTEIPWKNDF